MHGVGAAIPQTSPLRVRDDRSEVTQGVGFPDAGTTAQILIAFAKSESPHL
jgi:hypothetical protein